MKASKRSLHTMRVAFGHATPLVRQVKATTGIGSRNDEARVTSLADFFQNLGHEQQKSCSRLLCTGRHQIISRLYPDCWPNQVRVW